MADMAEGVINVAFAYPSARFSVSSRQAVSRTPLVCALVCVCVAVSCCCLRARLWPLVAAADQNVVLLYCTKHGAHWVFPEFF